MLGYARAYARPVGCCGSMGGQGCLHASIPPARIVSSRSSPSSAAAPRTVRMPVHSSRARSLIPAKPRLQIDSTLYLLNLETVMPTFPTHSCANTLSA